MGVTILTTTILSTMMGVHGLLRSYGVVARAHEPGNTESNSDAQRDWLPAEIWTDIFQTHRINALSKPAEGEVEVPPLYVSELEDKWKLQTELFQAVVQDEHGLEAGKHFPKLGTKISTELGKGEQVKGSEFRNNFPGELSALLPTGAESYTKFLKGYPSSDANLVFRIRYFAGVGEHNLGECSAHVPESFPSLSGRRPVNYDTYNLLDALWQDAVLAPAGSSALLWAGRDRFFTKFVLSFI